MEARNCIFFQLAKASQAGVRFWAGKLSPFKVTPVQGLALIFLGEEDQITSVRLGKRVQLDSATLTGILDRLERNGLVERRKNPRDRRSILICLTPEGWKISDEIRLLVKKANREFLSKLTDEEERTLRALLRKIRS